MPRGLEKVVAQCVTESVVIVISGCSEKSRADCLNTSVNKGPYLNANCPIISGLSLNSVESRIGVA